MVHTQDVASANFSGKYPAVDDYESREHTMGETEALDESTIDISLDQRMTTDNWVTHLPTVTSLFSITPKLVVKDRTIMVDTNYLIQVNSSDIISMLFDSGYENTVPSPLKKQMAKLFRNALTRKIDLCFSNFIMREFIGRAARRKELLEVYKRYISVITPNKGLESCFLDLAAAINSALVDRGKEGDIKDTYSYVLAALAGVRYFVTEDADVERLHNYLIELRKKDNDARAREIRKIKAVFGALCDIQESTFPVDDVLRFLCQEQLTAPVSIARLQESISEVLTRTDTILWMFRSLNETEWMKRLISKLPKEFDKTAIDEANARIERIAKDIEIERLDGLDADSFLVKLIERGSDWSEEPTDARLAAGVSQQLDLLQALLYDEDNDYRSLEEEFQSEESTKVYIVECLECGEQFGLEAEYQGVVETDQRAMGTESTHEWSTQNDCPRCGHFVEVIYNRWEYPQDFINIEDTQGIGCRIVSETARKHGSD